MNHVIIYGIKDLTWFFAKSTPKPVTTEIVPLALETRNEGNFHAVLDVSIVVRLTRLPVDEGEGRVVHPAPAALVRAVVSADPQVPAVPVRRRCPSYEYIT